MSSYSDMYKDQKQAEFIRTWAPDKLPELTPENLRYNITRANAAEAELREIKDVLRKLKGLLNA